MRYYWGLGRERAETPRQGSRPAEDAVGKGIPMMRFARRFSPLIVVVGLVASDARGQTLDIQLNVLMGATDVQVGGTLYDVVFVDGTCIELFDGCDDLTDFVLPTYHPRPWPLASLAPRGGIEPPTRCLED